MKNLHHTLGSACRRGLLVALAFGGAGWAQAQTQGVSDTEIVIGAIPDLSGPVVSVGAPVRDGMILATEEINAAGGIHGRKIRLVFEDTGYDPKKAVLATQKLISQDKVFALMNAIGSAVVQASQPVAVDRGVPYLFPLASSEITFLPHSPLKFALNALSADHLRAAIAFAHNKLGKRRFGILVQDDETGVQALRAAEEQLKVHGLTLLEKTSYKRGETNLAAQIARLKAANLDMLVLGTIVRETAAAAIEAKAQGWAVEMIIPWAVVNAVVQLGGPAVEGLYGATQFLNSAQPMTPAYQAFTDKFKARFGRDVGDGVNYGYLSMMLFAEGARNAGRNLSAASFAQGMEKIKDFKTVFETAPVSYSPTSHAPPRPAFILQVKGGKWVRVDGPLTY